MATILGEKIKALEPLTDDEALAAAVSETTAWAKGAISLHEFLRRITVIGSLVDLDKP